MDTLGKILGLLLGSILLLSIIFVCVAFGINLLR